MAKIAIVSAGGYVFPLRLIGDLLSFPAPRGSTLSLMDLHLAGAERTAAAARELAEHHGRTLGTSSTSSAGSRSASTSSTRTSQPTSPVPAPG